MISETLKLNGVGQSYFVGSCPWLFRPGLFWARSNLGSRHWTASCWVWRWWHWWHWPFSACGWNGWLHESIVQQPSVRRAPVGRRWLHQCGWNGDLQSRDAVNWWHHQQRGAYLWAFWGWIYLAAGQYHLNLGLFNSFCRLNWMFENVWYIFEMMLKPEIRFISWIAASILWHFSSQDQSSTRLLEPRVFGPRSSMTLKVEPILASLRSVWLTFATSNSLGL